MPHNPWPSVGEFTNPVDVGLVSQRLKMEGIPHRIAPAGLNRDRLLSIWVPPDWLERARELLSHDAVPEDDLTRAALSYPPPDDADSLK